uniref:DUF3778 domain-containing protein n=1 Tax=Oryza rufipogon TaxID=4529 RepID=A0A0E0QXL1_ORYRU
MQGLSFGLSPDWICNLGLQSELLRFNDELRGNLLQIPVMLTPKSTASHQTSHMCHSRGGSRRGLPVRQAEYTSIEALGCNRRGIAAVPFDLSLVKDGPSLRFILGDVLGNSIPLNAVV